MSSFEITGKLIVKDDTQQVSDKFKKREFVVELENDRNPEWNDFIKFQITQDRCDILDAYEIGDTMNVHFNIRGRKWEKDGKVNYFSNMEAWRLEKIQEAEAVPEMPPETEDDDLPF